MWWAACNLEGRPHLHEGQPSTQKTDREARESQGEAAVTCDMGAATSGGMGTPNRESIRVVTREVGGADRGV